MQGENPLRRLALLVEYQGTAFGGSQYQKNAPTVQDSLERALSSLTGEPIRVALAGRTDAGVHARGQVASFPTRSRHAANVFARGANALLRKDITVRAAAEVPMAFDPRRQALSRWYRYIADVSPQRSALNRQFVWHTGHALDVPAMAQAARTLVGRHDFAAFTLPSETRRRPTERNVLSADVGQSGRLVSFDIEANAFLPHMVRRIMGALAEVGLRTRTSQDFERLVLQALPGEARHTAPPQGLCLMKVRYESRLFDDETHEDI